RPAIFKFTPLGGVAMASRALVPPRFVLPTAPGLLAKVHEWITRSFFGLLRASLIAVLLAICYYLGTLLGLSLKPGQTAMATFWPPSAILLAAFLLTLRHGHLWWTFLLAVLPVHLLAQLPGGGTLPNVLGWFIANACGALIGALCIRFFEKESLFDSVKGVILFLGFGVIFAAVLKSLFDVALAVSTGLSSNYWMSWTTRLSANMISNLIIVPTIVLFGVNGFSWIRRATLARWVEAGLLAFCVVFVSMLVFS